MKCCFFLENTSMSLLGCEYLISVLRNSGVTVDVVFGQATTQVWQRVQDGISIQASVEEILSTNCAVAFTSVNAKNFQHHNEIFSELKRQAPHITTCFGGPQATYAHDYVVRQSGVDYLCRGEGEVAILEFLDFCLKKETPMPQGIYQFRDGNIMGVGYGRLVSNLDDLPFPDKSDYFQVHPEAKDLYTVMSGRGCYNTCTFCNSPTIRDGYKDDGYRFMRRRSVDDLISELKFVKKKIKPKSLVFVDDVFIHGKKYMIEFAEKYLQEINLPYACSTIPKFFNEEIIDRLVEGGLVSVEVGVQSLNEDIRINILGRHESNEQFARFVRMLRERRVYVNTDQIINPWDTVDDITEQVKLYNKIKPSFINVFTLQYFPGTKIIDYAIGTGYLEEKQRGDFDIGNPDSFLNVDVSESNKYLKGQILLLSLSPFLPSLLVRALTNKHILSYLKYLPNSLILLFRTLSALLRSGDIIGRGHIGSVIRSILGISPKPYPGLIDSAKELSAMKGISLLSKS